MPPDLMSFISESITELVNNYTTVCFEALTNHFIIAYNFPIENMKKLSNSFFPSFEVL